MKNPPYDEYMGKKMIRSRKAVPSGGFKFKKSGGANASVGRFGMDEDKRKSPRLSAPKKPRRRTMEYDFKRDKVRGPIPAIGGPARKDYISGKKEYKLPRNLGKTPFGPKGGRRFVGQRVVDPTSFLGRRKGR